jgi:hypothetical protein
VAVVVGSLQIEINFLLYISFLKPQATVGALNPGSLRFDTTALALLSLVCCFFLLKALARHEIAVPSVNGRR